MFEGLADLLVFRGLGMDPASHAAAALHFFVMDVAKIFVLLVIVIFLMVVMTERRKAGRKVRDQLAFQETLMDAIPQLISWKDHTGKYTGANRSFTRFFGLEHNRDIIG